MMVRAKNVAIDPVYWHYGVKWPFGVVMEYDLADAEYAAIHVDPRFSVEPAVASESAAEPERKRKGR